MRRMVTARQRLCQEFAGVALALWAECMRVLLPFTRSDRVQGGSD